MLNRFFLSLFVFAFSSAVYAQNLTISSTGQTGTSGTNWSIVGDVLNVSASGTADINTSVITNHLLNVGNLTIILPWQSGVARHTYINNTIAYLGSSARTLTIQSANDIIFANATGITSSTASLNVVLRSALGLSLGAPDNGLVKLDGVNIDTKGGHFWVGGGTTNTTWNGLTVGNSNAVTWLDDLSGISIFGSTIAANGGNIYMNGQSWNSADADGINYGINFENSVMSSGTGAIYLEGRVNGKYTNGTGMRIYGTTTTSITSTTGAIYIYGYGTDATTNGNAGRTATTIQGTSSIKSESGAISVIGESNFASAVDKEGLMIASGTSICSMTGNITLRGTNTMETSGQYSNSIRFDAANAANSIRIGYDGTNAYSGNITIEGNSVYQRNTNSGAGSIAIQTTGTLTIQPSGNSFTYMRAGDSGTLTFDNDWNFGTNLGGFIFGKTTNTTALTYSNTLTTNGPITMFAGALTLNAAVSSGAAITFNSTDFTLGDGINISTSTASIITINASGTFATSGTTRRTISSANGNIIIHADKDANGSGSVSIDFLTINPGSGNIIIRFETVDWFWGSGQQPYLNGTGSITIEPSDASFPYGISTAWFFFDQDNNGFSGLTLGKSGNTQDITHTGSAVTVAGPVNMYGNTITFSSALTTSGDLSLNSNTAVTQTAAIIAAGLSLNGTGTFTLTNTSNNFATLAGGLTGSLLGATQIIDVSGGLTIGTVGSISGLTGSSTIRVETLAGNITLAGSISTTSTSTDAVILTAAKSTAIGVPTGGDIIVSGSPTITMGTGAIAKLFSGYDVTSTGLTTLVGGATNARYNYDETSTTYNPTLSANNKYAIYRTALGYGDLNIVSSGGDTEGSTWTYSNGVITTISGTANVLNTVIQTKLNNANLSIEANKVTFSANVIGTTSNSFSILSKTHILNTIATTITTQGGHVLFASNVDDATDGESTTNGYTQLRFGITINSNGGNITFGGGNTSGSDYSFGSSIESYTEGIRFDGVIALNSGGGNIVIRGKSYAMGLGAGFGASGVGFYYFSAATGTINSGTGTITIDGFSQTNGSSYSSGFYCMNNMTISSANTSASAISISGKATGINGDAVGIETEGTFSVLATADGGGITIRSSQQIANFYDVLFRAETNILAKSGPIQLLGKQDGGVANGRWYNGNNFYLGSKALSTVLTSSSPVTIEYDLYDFSNLTPKIATSGTFNWRPASTSFGQNVATSWFSWNQNSQTISGLTLGKSGNSASVYLNSVLTVAGPISVYGGYVEVSGAITNSATGDILLKGITNSGSCINIIAGITKSSGTGTLTLQGHGRVNVSAAIAASGSASLNVILWSDYDSDNVGGGSTLSGSISTNGGHVWLGGSNSIGGSYNWNGLAVGDGPSTGASGANCNAIDLFGPITTAGGDVLLWASNNGGCGISGIQSDGTRLINVGSGDITFISDQTAGAIELTSTGVVSLLPEGGSYASALTLGGTLSSGNYTFNTSHYNGLKINSLSTSGLVVGNYSGHLSGTTSITQGNSSNVTVSSALSTKSLEIYGGAIALNENITTTGTNTDVLIKAMSNINLAAAKTITTAAGDVNLWSDSDNNSTGYVQLLAGAAINSTGGDINLGGGSDLTSDYAMGTTAETCPEVTGTQYISGVHLRQGASLASTGGNISVRGQNATTANAAMSFGISLRGISMNAGTGKIAINGVANGSGSVNAQGVASWGTLTLRSANTSSDAISLTGNALASTGTSSLGVNTVALFEATGIGGGIVITGKSGVASTNASINISGDILAVSGPIILSGENISGVQDNIFMGSTTVIGKKALTNVTTSNSNVILEGNKIVTSGSVLVDCSGTLAVQPFGASFASALTWPMTNVTHASNLGGLTLGKLNNVANITIDAATSINGPITLYGGTLALNNTLTTTNTSTGNLSLNGTTLSGSSTLTVANGRTLTMNLSSTTNYTGLISGTSLNFIKDGAGTLTLPTPTALSFAAMTISGGTYKLKANQQLTLSGVLTNNGTFTMKDGATFVQATSGTSIDGTGTYNVEKALTDNSSTWSTTSGRFWYMGVPMVNVARSCYGTPGTTTNRVWSYSEATKQYTDLSTGSTLLSSGTGYVHRRTTNDTITFNASGLNGLYGSDLSLINLSRTVGSSSGYHLISNPYMAYLDWDAVTKTNVEPTFYIRSNNSSGPDISALISYNSSNNQFTNTSGVSITNAAQIRHIAPMQSIWVRVGGTIGSVGSLEMNRGMLSHQSGNPGLKNSSIFPILARVNLVDGTRFDQTLILMNQDMINGVDQYDSEKMMINGSPQLYTMSSGKKLVMNSLKNDQKKISVPLYLELPETKSYTLQLSEFMLDDGKIILEDKQEGTMQEFTAFDSYTFYANSGLLQDRFVIHFYLFTVSITNQGPSEDLTGPQPSFTTGSDIEILANENGKVQITIDQPVEEKISGEVQITDLSGRVVYAAPLSGITTEFELIAPSGIYYLIVTNGTQIEKKKVFIQN